MSQPKNRLEKIQALLPTVRAEGEGVYTVESLTLKGWRYFIHPKTATSPATCQCEDYRRQAPQVAGYRCIHLLAVRAHIQAQPKRPPTIKQSLDNLAVHLKTQQSALSAKARYQEARERIVAGEGDDFTSVACLDSWLEYVGEEIDALPEDEIPEGLALIE